MKNTAILIIGVILIAIFGLFLFMFQVRQTEVAVVTRFGRPHRDITEPGAYYKLPWPVEKVHRFDKRIQVFEDSFEETFTQDQYNLLVSVYAGWTIAEPKVFFPRFGKGSTQEAIRSLEGLVRSAKNAVVGQHRFSDFISTDTNQLQFVEIEQEILSRIQEKAAKEYGIEVKFLGIQRLGLPESVTRTVFERMRSEREVLVSRIQSAGDEEAARIRAEAERLSNQLMTEAISEATRLRGEADAKALESFKVFEQEPGFANFLLSLGALQSVLTNRTTLIVDERTIPFNLLTQPVPKELPAASPRASTQTAQP